MSSTDFDRRITDWLGEEAPPWAPEDLVPRVAERAARTRRRPAWATYERWISMETRAQLGAVPRGAIILVTIGLLTALVAGAIVSGSGGSPEPRLPAPAGPAANGLIAYANWGEPWRQRWDIWVLEPETGRTRQLTSGPALDSTMSWSPDGLHLAFWSIEWPEVEAPSADAIIRNGSASLKVLDARNGDPGTFMSMHLEPRVLVSGLRVQPTYFLAPSWAPDSGRLVYAHLEDDVAVIDVISSDGSTASPIRVTEGSSPAWSPDGDRIAYRSGRYSGAGAVWLVDPDGSDPVQLTTIPGSGWAFTAPGWSPDGDLITFYAGPDGGHDIWAAHADGSGEMAASADIADEYWCSFSPDGSRIGFQRPGPKGDANFVLVDADGSDLLVLPERVGINGPVVWAPDATGLLGMRGSPGGGAEVVFVAADGSTPAKLLATVENAELLDIAWQRVAP